MQFLPVYLGHVGRLGAGPDEAVIYFTFPPWWAGIASRVELALDPSAGIRVILDQRRGPRRKVRREYPGQEHRQADRRQARKPLVGVEAFIAE